NKSICDICLLLNIPRSTVSGIITKWKQLGTATLKQQSGRQCKITEGGQRMLKRTVLRCRQLSAESIAKGLQTSCGLQRASWNGFPRLSSCIQAKLTSPSAMQ
ncbi:unnamed protein product, partial [Staurois parvus]